MPKLMIKELSNTDEPTGPKYKKAIYIYTKYNIYIIYLHIYNITTGVLEQIMEILQIIITF